MSRPWISALAAAVLALGCAGGAIRELHPVGGNEFTLFPGAGRAPPPVTCSGDVDERFACFCKELESNTRTLDVAGAFAVVAADGRIRALAKTDSLNGHEHQVSADTRFPAASVTKMFVAAATLSLSQETALDLQQPIWRYLPELARDVGVGRATLHQLLTHTSGLGSPAQCEQGEEDLADMLKKYGAAPLWAPPGAVYNYSNLGYGFVALVLERVTGKPFEEVVRERVLIPAGIAGASFGFDQLVVRGHGPDGNAVLTRCRAMWPSGGLVLSVRELARWASELARPDSFPLGRPLLELLTAPHVKMAAKPGAAYGYGVQRFDQSGLTVFSHAGRLEGFSAFVAWLPERQLGVAAFADTAELLPVATGFRALSTFASISEDWQPARVPSHALDDYTGVYVDRVATLGRLRVSLEQGHLVIDYLDAAPPQLTPGFGFVFEPGARRARYVVTPIGVGERSADTERSASPAPLP
jgi:CubicO group peptidase (beta-lactamase class C family)